MSPAATSGTSTTRTATPHWRQPKGERKLIELKDPRLWSSEYGGPQDWLERSIAHLAEHRRAVSAGTFVFLLSDFIPAPSDDVWLVAFEHRWDFVPVVIQDPVWEQSFPDVSGIVVPLRDPDTGRVSNVRLTRREAEARRDSERGANARAHRRIPPPGHRPDRAVVERDVRCARAVPHVDGAPTHAARDRSVS